MVSTDWKELAAKKKQAQRDAIPAEWLLPADKLPPREQKAVTACAAVCGLLSARELEITDGVDVGVLLGKLASGEWSAYDVTLAYYKRAIIAHQLTNCLTEIFVEQALKRAKELDDHHARTGQLVGPLHGLPVSLKDQFSIEGLDTTMGYTSWIGKPATKNCTLVDLLLAAGAVPFVRTNVPQTLMWPETFNFIFGRTLNPHNRTLTSGGSSGGEAALIALKGSPLGVGSDIGGSVRIPAGACGIYGFRTSYHRLPYRGAMNSLIGQDSLPSVAGPMSNSIEGLVILMRAILGQKPWLYDPLALRKPWDEDAFQLADHDGGRKLCFGILWDDGNYKPLPPQWRAMDMAKKALLAAGHTVIDWEPLNHRELIKTAGNIFGAGGNRDFDEVLEATGEPLLDSLIPEDVEHYLKGVPRTIRVGADTYGLWQHQKRKTELREMYLDHWNATVAKTGTGRPVDAIVLPVAPFPAPPHGLYRIAAYTNVWNVLDYPSCVVPVTRVSQNLDAKAAAHEFRNDEDKIIYDMYTGPEAFENAPISLQVVGRTQEDEAVLAMAIIVDQAVKVYNKSNAVQA